MAGIQWNWTKVLVLVALGFAAGAARIAVAQALAANTGGAIAGRLTDLHSVPLAGVTVVVRNEATGAETRTTTSGNGGYLFVGLDPGQYAVEAQSEQLGRGRLEGIFVAAGHETRVQTAMEFQVAIPGSIQTAYTPAIQTSSNPAIQAISISSIQPESLAFADTAAILPAQAAEHVPFQHSASAVATVTPVVTAMVAPQPLLTIPLVDHSWAGRLRPELSVQWLPVGSPPVNGAIEEEAFLPLVLKGQAWSGESSLALPEAAEVAAKAAALLDPLALQARRAGGLLAAAPNVDPVATVVTTTVTGEQLQALPVSGRRWQDFVLDAPTAATDAGGAAQTSLRGVGQEPIETTIDGAGTRLAFGGQSSPASAGQFGADQNGMGQAWASGHGFAVAEAAIREVQIVAGNVEAAGSRAAGGRMNVGTERGGNGLHGQGFISDRQNTWGARNPFTQWVKETVPATETTTPVFTAEPYTPPDHETTWGLGVGSQIRRDKLFWFAALDRYQRNDPGLSTVKTPEEFFAQPSNDQMQVLSARLGLSSSNPVAAGLAAYSKLLGELDGQLGPASRTAAQWIGFSRIDWQAADRHRFTLEGIGAVWNSPGGGLTRVSESYGTNSFGSSQASEEWLLGRWETFLTPNLLSVTQGSMARNIQSARPETPSPFEQTFLSSNVWGQLPQIVADSRYGFTIGNPSRFGQGSYPDERLYQAQESVNWVRGSLLMKAGFDVSHNSDATSLLQNQTGTYTYSSVENFASDALVFAAFGVAQELNTDSPHNCDQTGKVWRDANGQLRGLGYLPCYAYYSQVIGPADWHLSTNDWAGYATAQWQPLKLVVFSAGLRWEREQLPPPIAALANSELPLTERMPSLGYNWGPRVGLAVGSNEMHWPVLRMGYGMYFGRTENTTVETALNQTGSPHGDLNFFMRPTDNLNSGGAPPFPYVLAGEPGSMVKPGAVEFAPEFHNPEVDQGVMAVEESLPGNVQLIASAMVSLGRRLPVSIDTNFDPAVDPGTITYGVVDGTGLGPIKATQITVPFYASWPSRNSPTGFGGRLNPDYQQITQIMSRANSTYEAAMVKITRFGRRGLNLHAHYTYSHAMDWNPNESTTVAGSDVLDPENFSQEYGTSNLDMRHSAAAMLIYQAPWKMHGPAGRLANGWMLSATGQFRSGMPYTMRTSGSLAEEFNVSTGAAIVGLGPGMNGSGGDNRVYGLGRNTYRYPSTWKIDMRLGKGFDFGHARRLELLAESFNLLNHQNVTELETTGYYLESGSLSGTMPTLNFLTGLKANTTAFGQPLGINATNFYRERQIQVGLKMRF